MRYADIIQLKKSDYIDRLAEVQWFKYADQQAVEEALRDTQNNLMWLYTLEEFVFNEEEFNDAESYQQFLQTLLMEFQIDFKAISADQDENLIGIKIETSRGHYEYVVDLDDTDGYFDEALISFFLNKELLVKEQIIERFFFLPQIDENLSIYFTHPTIQHKAAKAGLIPGDNEFFDLIDSIKEDEEELDN